MSNKGLYGAWAWKFRICYVCLQEFNLHRTLDISNSEVDALEQPNPWAPQAEACCPGMMAWPRWSKVYNPSLPNPRRNLWLPLRLSWKPLGSFRVRNQSVVAACLGSTGTEPTDGQAHGSPASHPAPGMTGQGGILYSLPATCRKRSHG